MLMDTKEQASLYFSPEQPGSFAGASTFAKNQTGVSKPEKWLQNFPAYSLHKPVRKRFKRNRVIVGSIDHLWQLDLTDLSRISEHNDGYRFLCFCIDVLSKYLWIEPLKDKKADTLVAAFQRILKSGRKPLAVQTDQGTEFWNNKFKRLLKENNIKFYYTHNAETKASIVERVQRTIKSKMWRYFTHKNSYRYIDHLQNMVKSYNSTFHRSIGTKPSLVNTRNAQVVWQRLYSDLQDVPNISFKFNIGDKVRILNKNVQFRKGYEQAWSQEIFQVTERLPREPHVYRISDLLAEPVIGTWYEHELQKCNTDEKIFIIDKDLKTRTRNKKKQYFVSWKGWPDKFNSWVTELYNV